MITSRLARKMTLHRGLALLSVSVLVGALVFLGVSGRPASAVGPSAPDQMKADADGVSPGVQASANVPLNTSFSFAIWITAAEAQGYDGYQWEVEFPSAAFDLDLNSVAENPATGLSLCGKGGPNAGVLDSTNDSAYGGGCGGFSPPYSTFTGQSTTFNMTCKQAGQHTVYLLDLVQYPGGGSTLIHYPNNLDTGTTNATIFCGPTPTPTPTATPTPGPNKMAADANGMAPGVQSTRSVPIRTNFTIGVWITQAGAPYDGYQWEVAYPIVAFSYQGGTNSSPWGTGCVPITQRLAVPDPASVAYYGGCIGSPDTTYTGQVATITLQCNAPGPFTIRLLDYNQDPGSGSTLFVNGAQIAATSTSNVTINCTAP